MKAIVSSSNECIQVDVVKQALQRTEKKQIIDVCSKEEFANNHIPKAINITLTEIENQIDQIKKDRKIITVCGKGGERSMDGAKLLKEM
ncbi:rhodanese-like domain-containing protein [Flavobacterium sp. GT2N3]|uniref:rhodanese-like domain-containing protein n=1 Tax=unclassified Flavobacterium TaxID=196869 RepID=UPI003AAD1BDD